MKHLLAALAALIALASPAAAQNTICPTAPPGTVNNQCASTAFVANAVTVIGGLPSLANGAIWIGDPTNAATPRFLSGDILVTNSGVTTIQPAAVTFAKIQNLNGSSLMGNPSGIGGPPTNIAIGATFLFAGSTLQTAALTGDVTAPANSFFTTIGTGAVTTAKLALGAVTYPTIQNVSAGSLLGNPTGAPASPSEIVLGATLQFFGGATLRTSNFTGDVTAAANSFATTISAGAVTTAKIAFNAVTNALLAQAPANTVKGNSTNALGNAADITVPACTGSNFLQWTAGSGFICTATSGSGSAGAAIAINSNVISVDPTYYPNFLQGCALSNDGTFPNTTLDIAACVSVGATTWIKGIAFTKLISTQGNACTNAFVAGTGQCGMINTVAPSTWYYAFAITCTAAYDVYFDTSNTGANAPGCATDKRRIGAFRTDGTSHIVAFYQNGNDFFWRTPVQDVNVATLGTTATNFSLTVPSVTGISARSRYNMFKSATIVVGTIFSPLETGTTAAGSPTGNNQLVSQVTGGQSAWDGLVLTDGSARVSAVSSSAATTLFVVTYGWVDPRGQQ